MADHPILFNAPMIRALLREIDAPGTGKTQTRRIIKPDTRAIREGDIIVRWGPDIGGKFERFRPRFRLGDRLWVRETWRAPFQYDTRKPSDVPSTSVIAYEAGEDGIHLSGKLRPCLHMPRWASRLTLYVTEVRVERLQDISEADAIAEGIERDRAAGIPGAWGWHDYLRGDEIAKRHFADPRESYRTLWGSINGPGTWDEKPWVAAYTFVPRIGNIDTLPATLKEAA